MRFEYTALTSQGATQTGVLEASSAEEARAKLAREGVLPIEVKPVGGGLLERFRGKKALPRRELIRIYRDLARMTNSGMELPEALATVAEIVQRPNTKSVIQEALSSLEGGLTFSEALRSTEAFPEDHIAAIRAAEATGVLHEALEQLAKAVEEQQSLIGEIKGALTYPAIILGMAVVISYYLLTRMVPKILSTLKQVGLKKLPMPTQIVMGISDFLQHYGLYLVIAFAGGVYAFALWARTPAGRQTVDRTLLRLPMVGTIAKNLALVKMLQNLGFLLASRVDLPQALEIAAKASGNTVLEDALLDVRRRVLEGERVDQAFAAHKAIFGPMVVAAVKIGARSASLAEPLYESAAVLSQDTRTQTSLLSKALEPLMLLVLALAVGAIVLAIFLPMYDLLSQIQGGRR